MRSFEDKFGPNPTDETLRNAFVRDPAALGHAIRYIDHFEPNWVFDPKEVAVPQVGRTDQMVERAEAILAARKDGWAMSVILRKNLEIVKSPVDKDNESPILTLRPGYRMGEGIDLSAASESERLAWRFQSAIEETVKDPAQPGIMTTALVMVTGAKLIRDDIEEGNQVGRRAYKGRVRGVPVYFSETIELDEEGDLVRSLWADTQQTAEEYLDALSLTDRAILRSLKIQLADPLPQEGDSPVYYQPEVPTRQKMIGVLRLYQALAVESDA